MRRMLLSFACVSLALAASAACATSDDGPIDPAPSADGGGDLRLDAEAPVDAGADAPLDARREPPTCSPAGWCPTELPDDSFDFVDIHPFPNRAFGIGANEVIGLKVLEWEKSTNQWSFIDDNQPNGVSRNLTNIWAPSEDEVYVAQMGIDFSTFAFLGTVYHGRRSKAPATSWTWEALPSQKCGQFATPLVRGTGPNDIYLSFCNSVYRLNPTAAGDGGDASPWTLEYSFEENPDNVLITDIVGTGPDDLWIAGGRGSQDFLSTGYGGCGILVHKDASGYTLVADGNADPTTGECSTKEGFERIPGAFTYGANIAGNRQFVGVTRVSIETTDVAKIVVNADGTITHSTSHPTVPTGIVMMSMWGLSPDELWFVTGRYAGGGSTVLQGTNVFTGGGSYEYSTVSINGESNPRPFHRIRGTSNADLWAIGDRRALHKTNP